MPVLPDPMVTPIRRPWRPAAALAVALPCALAPPAARPAAPAMLDAGTEGGYTFTIEAKSLVRDGERVRFRLLSANVVGGDHYDSTIEVDCAHRTRRQLSAIADDGAGDVRRYGDELSGLHAVSQGTRADRELRLACARAGLHAAEPPHRAAPASDLVDVGTDAAGAHAIFIDSVRRRDAATIDYMLQTIAPGQGDNATRQRFVVDCDRRLRALDPEDAAAGTRLPARRVSAASREERELATACTMPEGPRQRWFAGLVVSPDGVVVAPHARTVGCGSIVTIAGGQRRTLELIANEQDIALLRIPGNDRWTTMPASADASVPAHVAVTLLGVSGTAPRVSAAFVEQAGASRDDSGWPQVRTLADRAMTEGVVWNESGEAIGLALAVRPPDVQGRTALVRMLPAGEIRQRLLRHGLAWLRTPADPAAPEAAMRTAMQATVPLICRKDT
ncbi:MAG: hypothetical protein ACJ8G1_04235 [Vitreoscilla sp.]